MEPTRQQRAGVHVADGEPQDRGLVQMSHQVGRQGQEMRQVCEHVRLFLPSAPRRLSADRPGGRRTGT